MFVLLGVIAFVDTASLCLGRQETQEGKEEITRV